MIAWILVAVLAAACLVLGCGWWRDHLIIREATREIRDVLAEMRRTRAEAESATRAK